MTVQECLENRRIAGNKFKEIRNANNFTQDQVASYLKVDRSLIAKFEKGERSLQMSQIERASSLFGCDSSTILKNKEYSPLAVAYRAKDLSMEDLDTIARVNTIVLNLRKMKELERGD